MNSLFLVVERMSRSIATATVLLFVAAVACSEKNYRPAATEDATGVDSLNARLEQAYRSRDPGKYGVLFTDSGVFEWPAVNTVRGRPGLEAMARELWPELADLDLKVTVGSRRIAGDHATEFGAFEESWRDPKGVRMTEYGRYASYLVRQPDKTWLIDRWLGFEDSLRSHPSSPAPSGK